MHDIRVLRDSKCENCYSNAYLILPAISTCAVVLGHSQSLDKQTKFQTGNKAMPRDWHLKIKVYSIARNNISQIFVTIADLYFQLETIRFHNIKQVINVSMYYFYLFKTLFFFEHYKS